MPLVSRWYINVATIYLIGGLRVGVLQALPERATQPFSGHDAADATSDDYDLGHILAPKTR